MNKKYLTSAPADYDYHYIKTIKVLKNSTGRTLRLIESSDESRFNSYQINRYFSGLHFCWELDSDNAKYELEKETWVES